MPKEKLFEEHNERVAKMPAAIRDAHAHCKRNKRALEKSDLCGCFYCLTIFSPSEVKEWTQGHTRDDKDGSFDRSAICPHCGIDSVIGSIAGFPITKEFLGEMKSHWF